MRSPWKRVRYRLEWAALLLLAKVIPLLSRKTCLRLACTLGTLASIFDRHHRRVALSNLEVAFGNAFSIKDRRRIVRGSFQDFARTLVDFFWSPNLTRENFSRHIELQNFEECADAVRQKRGLIILCYHYSNFEWLSPACGFAGLQTTLVTQEFRNSLLDPVFRKMRERAGHEVIGRKGSMLHLYKALRRKGAIALLADLSVRPRHGVVIDCFGLKKSVTFAHTWLHAQTGAPIIPAHCEPLPGGRYRMIFHPRIDDTAGMTHQQIAQACWNSFEPYVRKNPAPWLWMYKHFRYRPANPDRSYPFYVRASPAFEKIIQREEGNVVGETSALGKPT
jgi:KDO2-lipid IV(A) lauroyltransferase